MTKEEVEKKVIEAACNHMQVNPTDFTLASDVVEDIGADSLDIEETVMAVEDALRVRLSDNFYEVNAGKVLTLGLLADSIWECLQKTPIG